MSIVDVLTVAQVREGISRYAKAVEADPHLAVFFGSHREAQAAIVNASRYQQLLEMEDRIKRQQAVDEALASSRLEGAEPDDIAKQEMARYVAGEMSGEELIARGRARYGLE